MSLGKSPVFECVNGRVDGTVDLPLHLPEKGFHVDSEEIGYIVTIMSAPMGLPTPPRLAAQVQVQVQVQVNEERRHKRSRKRNR